MARERLGELLINAGLLDQAGLDRALSEQKRWGGYLGRYLVELGLISEETLVRALSTQCRVPAVAIEPHRLDGDVARLIPQELCEKHRVVCFGLDAQKRFIDVAMADPLSPEIIDEIRVHTRHNVRPYFAAPSAINDAIAQIFYGESSSIGGTIDIESGQPTAGTGRVATPLESSGPQRPSEPPGQILPPPVALPDDGPGQRPPPPHDYEIPQQPGPVRPAPPPAPKLGGFDETDGEDHTVRRARPSDLQMSLEVHVARQAQVIQLLLAALVKSRVMSPDQKDELERLLRGE